MLCKVCTALQRDKAALHPGTRGSVGAGAHSDYSDYLIIILIIDYSDSDITNSFNIKDVGLRIFEDFAKSWQWIVAWVQLFSISVYLNIF